MDPTDDFLEHRNPFASPHKTPGEDDQTATVGGEMLTAAGLLWGAAGVVAGLASVIVLMLAGGLALFQGFPPVPLWAVAAVGGAVLGSLIGGFRLREIKARRRELQQSRQELRADHSSSK